MTRTKLNTKLVAELVTQANNNYLRELVKCNCDEIWPLVGEPLSNLANLTLKRNISVFIFSIQPIKCKSNFKQLENKYGWKTLYKWKKYDFSNSKFWLHKKDQHPNPKGHELIAKELYRKIKR